MALIVDQFKGLIPALDRRQVKDPFVMEGRNFLFTTQGPASVFGNRFYSYDEVFDSVDFQSIYLRGRFFIFLRGAVLYDDLTLDTFIPSFSYSQDDTVRFPWSAAYVGGKYYFARKGAPLIQYSPALDEWAEIDNEWVPDGLVACTQAAGRLILLGATTVVYSAIDDGTDLTPDAGGTQAGFQLLAIAGGGNPLGVREVNQGFITYLDSGVIFSQSIESDVPFRHIEQATNVLPISPFCITDIDKRSHVILSKTGLYIVNSAQPQIWQPLMSEYLTNDLFREISPTVDGTYRLFYDDIRRLFFLSYARSALFQFTSAFVLYLPRDEWGSFDAPHSQICNLAPAFVKRNANAFSSSQFAISSTALCFMGVDGRIREFAQAPLVELFTDHPSYWHNYKPPSTLHANIQNSAWHFFNYGVGQVVNDATYEQALIDGETLDNLYDTATKIEYFDPSIDEIDVDEAIDVGYIYNNETFSDGSLFTDGTGFNDTLNFVTLATQSSGFFIAITEVKQPEFTHLDSMILVGAFRMTDQEQINREYAIFDFALGVSSAVEGSIEEDWNAGPDEEIDWLTAPDEEEDWGLGIASESAFSVELLNLSDAYQIKNTLPCELCVNELHTDSRRFQYTSGARVFYAAVRLYTVEPGDYFELKTFEINTLAEGLNL